jgi:hypothetical protein
MSSSHKLLAAVFLTAVLMAGCSSDNPADSAPEVNDDNLVILRSSSPHFNYYCVARDTVVIDTLSKLLESNLERVSLLYGFSIDDTIDVRIYPDFATFHRHVDWPTSDIPPTLVGQCVGPDEIKIISPLNSEPVNSYGEILLVAIHESIHAIHFHVYESRPGARYPPTWLFEGFASYEADLRPNPDIIRQRVRENNLPLIPQYEDADYFNDNYGYHFCYTIFRYLLLEYDYDKVSNLLRHPSPVAYALGDGVTMDTLNTGWHNYLIVNYSK